MSLGPRGTGKTHLLVVLGYRACELDITVRFTRVVDMLNDLVPAQVNRTLAKALREYVRPALLLADEVGYIPIDRRGADLMFRVVAALYETWSVVLTTIRPFKNWGTIFDADTTLATAMIDRLMHHGEAYAIRGDSCRMKDKEQGNVDDDDQVAGAVAPS